MFDSIRSVIKKKRSDLKLVLIYLSLIFIPSGLLGYFSWRALQTEKLLSQERLQESYRQYATLAAREIDHELQRVEKEWLTSVRDAIAGAKGMPSAEQMQKVIDQEPLISMAFLLEAPGRVLFPPGFRLDASYLNPGAWEKENHFRDYELFKRMIAEGENLENRDNDYAGATRIYQKVFASVTDPQLKGIALSYVGRALMNNGEWEKALEAFRELLANYAGIRDFNGLSLNFLSQYQIAVCLENLGKPREAIQAVLRLHQDLLEKSDTINGQQYSYFLNQIQTLSARILQNIDLPDREVIEAKFQELKEKSKKRLSQKYFLESLNRRLNKAVLERKKFKPHFHYFSNDTDGEPYLLGYRYLPDPSRNYVAGLFAIQIDLQRLQEKLFPRILQNLKFSDNIALAIINEKGDYVIGTCTEMKRPIATKTLQPPFHIWEVAVYLHQPEHIGVPYSFSNTLQVWLISLLFLSILFGAFLFVRRAQREAHLSSLKSTFVSNVSHELRTPLASIKMMAELLEMQLEKLAKSNPKLKARGDQYLGIISRECDRLTRLVESVLNFSRMEHGKRQFHFEYEDLAVVVRMAIESFQVNAEAQGFTLVTDIREPLPEMKMDADAIFQVILNLLNNALKFSDKEKKIWIRAYRQKASVIIEVEDHGIGIPAGEKAKIFKDFYRVDQRLNTEAQGGLGLGLTLAQDIVQAHHGNITVDSEVGKGSIFRVILPVQETGTLDNPGEIPLKRPTINSQQAEQQVS